MNNLNLNVLKINEQSTPIPDKPDKLIDLGIKVYARHCVMGDKSPLLTSARDNMQLF